MSSWNASCRKSRSSGTNQTISPKTTFQVSIAFDQWAWKQFTPPKLKVKERERAWRSCCSIFPLVYISLIARVSKSFPQRATGAIGAKLRSLITEFSLWREKYGNKKAQAEMQIFTQLAEIITDVSADWLTDWNAENIWHSLKCNDFLSPSCHGRNIISVKERKLLLAKEKWKLLP